MPAEMSPLLAPDDIDRLRVALGDYTVDGVHELLGLRGRSAEQRGDLTGMARELRRSPRSASPLADLVTLFLLGGELDESQARRALHPLALDTAVAAGLVTVSAGSVRAALDLRPHAEGDASETGAEAWWVLSDLGADVRPGPLAADHVLGVGAASLSLANATPRDQVGRALDIGTGSGVQALHLAGHSTTVTATDISARALRLAATTAALSGQHWDLRAGSLLAPVAGERFDLVVANPPFVVSAGDSGYDYRDSGLAGDAVSRTLLQKLPDILTPGGTAVLLANWIIPAGTSEAGWSERVEGWLSGRSCDAWVWQREVAEPGEYVAMWLRDAGDTPGSPTWAARYDAWCDWLESERVAAIGMGLAALWPTTEEPVLVLEDVRQAIEQPVGAQLPAWLARQRWLRSHTDTELLDAELRPARDLVRTRDDLLDRSGWDEAAGRLRQSHGLRWELEVDTPIAAVVAGCASGAPLRLTLELLAATLAHPVSVVAAAVLPVVRDLVGRGFLEPDGM